MAETIQQELRAQSPIPAGLVSFSLPDGGSITYEVNGQRQTLGPVTPGTQFFFRPKRIVTASHRVLGKFLPKVSPPASAASLPDHRHAPDNLHTVLSSWPVLLLGWNEVYTAQRYLVQRRNNGQGANDWITAPGSAPSLNRFGATGGDSVIYDFRVIPDFGGGYDFNYATLPFNVQFASDPN